ncbi:MAG: efflux RND transporter periplasmic adaptor subunit [Betaproteobacteria bacterium]|nr:efflux RND transporter periplasmic adaptor subunit [Betaproteobacteria bacterium]
MQRIIFAVALCAATTAHAVDQLTFTARQLQSLGVITTPIASTQSQTSLNYPATVDIPANQVRIVAAPMTGMVSRVWVTANTSVKVGQPLATLLSPELAQAQGGLVQAAAQAQLAQMQLQRDDQLLADGIIAASRQQTTRANYLSAQAMLTQHRQSLRMLGVPAITVAQMEHGIAHSAELQLSAPISGVVLEASVTAGQRVDPTTALFKIAQMRPLWLVIQVPGPAAAHIKVNDSVSLVGRAATGRVLSIAQNTQASQTVAVRAEINGDLDGLFSGQAVEAKIRSAVNMAWQAPVSAIVYQQNNPYIFVRDAHGFHPVAVQVLAQTGAMAIIAGKLSPADMIATQGVAQIKAVWSGAGGV